MKKLAINIIFYLLITIPNGVAAFLLGEPAFAIPVVAWLLMPCGDPDFGNGRRWYRIRQIAFMVGGFIVAVLGLG